MNVNELSTQIKKWERKEQKQKKGKKNKSNNI